MYVVYEVTDARTLYLHSLTSIALYIFFKYVYIKNIDMKREKKNRARFLKPFDMDKQQ